MKTVRDLIKKKGNQVSSVTPDMTVYDTLKLMADKEIGAVLVLEEGRPVGMFSERDYARKGIIRGRQAHKTLVSELMTAPLITVRPEQSIEECMQLMTERRIRHLPVIDDTEIVGMVTIGDVVMHMITQQRNHIEQLEGYIAGRY